MFRQRKARGIITAITITILEAYIAIPSSVNIVQKLLDIFFQVVSFCPGTFCDTEIVLKLIPTILGVLGVIDGYENDFKSISFIQEQIRKGKFL